MEEGAGKMCAGTHPSLDAIYTRFFERSEKKELRDAA